MAFNRVAIVCDFISSIKKIKKTKSLSTVPTGLRGIAGIANPALKRGANNHCAYGAGEEVAGGEEAAAGNDTASATKGSRHDALPFRFLGWATGRKASGSVGRYLLGSIFRGRSRTKCDFHELSRIP